MKPLNLMSLTAAAALLALSGCANTPPPEARETAAPVVKDDAAARRAAEERAAAEAAAREAERERQRQAAEAARQAERQAAMMTYTVVSGDSLWKISGRPEVYADPYRWPLIYKRNSDKIEDADLIYPGQVFDIDRNPASTDIDAAVRHARTRGAWKLGEVEASDRAYLAR